MTQDQINSLIRQFLMIVGGGAGTFFMQKGLLSPEQMSFFAANGPALIGLVMALGGAVWGMIAHKQANMVATVAAMPEVARVTTAPTPAGDALAEAAVSTPAALVVKSV